jgi:hypothetical protein
MCNISSPFDDKDDNVADNEINKQLHWADSLLRS